MHRWRLFPKYALLIIALVGGMLLAASAISLYFSWREARSHLVALQIEKAQGAAARIEQYIAGIEQQLGWTALPSLDAAGAANPVEGRRFEILKLLRQAPPVTEVAWIDERGREQIRVSRLAMDAVSGGADVSREPKFLVAKSGKVWYSPVHFRKETEPYLTIARPAGGNAGGVIAAEVNLKFVWEVVSLLKVGKRGIAYVIDDAGNLIAHPDISLVLKKIDMRTLPQVAALKDGIESGAARDVSGEPVLSAHAPIPTLGWQVFVETPRAEALAPLYASIARLALLLAGGLALATAASFLLARALVRPIRAIEEGAVRLGAGELDRRIEVRTGDELEGLANQFNRMGEQLRESYAGLERKVEARTAELSEALQRQTATADILRVISGSITDAQPVFEAIVQSGHRLFGEGAVALTKVQDDRLVRVARAGLDPPTAQPALDSWPLDRDSATGAAILERRLIEVPDTQAALQTYPRLRQLATGMGFGSGLFVPLLREDQALGGLAIVRVPKGAFSREQVALAQTFADQAVIAIENARLFNETREALERQTATSDILRVISGSPTSTEPVFDAILASGTRLCEADMGLVLRYEAGVYQTVATLVPAPAFDAFPRQPIKAGPLSGLGRVAASKQAVHIPDLIDDEAYRAGDPLRLRSVELGGVRTWLGVPMLREGELIGAIAIYRKEVRPFEARQVEVLRTFADQAVIAIENVRLFNETKEALEQQTATAEVLQVISRSPTDVQPVFDAICERAMKLCDAHIGGVARFDGERVHLVAFHGVSREAAEAMRASFPMPLGRGAITARAILERAPVQIADVLEDPDYELKEVTRRAGYRANLAVPMLREGQVIGSIGVCREQPGAFPDKQVRLLQTFADQAVIAIENVRLFNETKEALEQQTAISEILRVISSSPTDMAPVLDAVARHAAQLCESSDARIFFAEGEFLRLVAGGGATPSLDTGETMPLSRGTVTGRAIIDREALHIEDLAGVPESEFPTAREMQRRFGHRTTLAVPLLREDKAFGAILLRRMEVRPFSAKQIALVKTFADQAAIAIENARLFNETTEALEQQTATSEILRVISNSVSDAQPVFDAILASCERLFDGLHTGITLLGEDNLIHLAAHRGSTADRAAFERTFPVPLARESGSGSAILERRVMHYPDIDAPEVPAYVKRSSHSVATRSVIIAPLLWEGSGVGAIFVARGKVGPFSDKDIALLKTFADQAVIAIQNARFVNETRDALEQQTATAEVLQVISSSVADTQPVFEKILQSCQHLFESSEQGILLIGDDAMLRLGAHRGATRERLARVFPQPLSEDGPVSIAVRERRVLHFPDVFHGADVPSAVRAVAEQIAIGNYSQVMAPMLWEGRGVGILYVTRQPPMPFSDKELGLLKTFADQAAIAIQNARLFNEIQAKSRELEQANKHKSEFLANMSHELRTPLNAIIGFSEVLTEQMFGEVNDKQLEYLRDIHSSGHHLLSLINDILDLSKIEAGRMELDLTTFDLGLLLDNSMTLVKERASRHGLALVLDVEDGIEDWVADARKVKQVVINLLSNAVKFTPPGGTVSLRARRTNGSVEIAVIDTGVGIAPDQQALVFEEFRQASGDYLRKSEGTGLGLSLARRFVELHGGAIRVESAPGRGSTFAFTLPERVLEEA
jgi:GAF domain-containing protein/HAMP domain-containing protein